MEWCRDKLWVNVLFGYRWGVAGFGCADRVERSVMALHPYCLFLSRLIRLVLFCRGSPS